MKAMTVILRLRVCPLVLFLCGVHLMPGAPPAPADASPPADTAQFSGMSLHEAVRMALEYNLSIKVEKLEERIGDARILGQIGEFEPSFQLGAKYESTEEPQNTREFVATQSSIAPRTSRIFVEDNWRWNTGIGGKLPTGTEYEFTVELNQLRNTLNIERPPSLFYPEYESFAGLKLVQPLLRDFGTGAQLAGLRVAQVDRRVATLGWKLKVNQMVAGVMKNYFDLVFATKDLQIKRENIGRARKLEGENRKRVEKGVGSEIEVQQATVAASVREEELINAEYIQREKASLLLRDLVSDVDIMALPRITPSHALSAHVPKIDKQALMRDAMANRIEYKQAQEQLTVQDIKVRFAKNQAWPRLDLFATLGANGLRSAPDSALSDAFEGSTPAWSAGIALTIPLGNQKAKAQLTEAQALREQLLLNFKQLEIDLALQVDIALARVQTSQKRLDTARQSVTAANATLEGEGKRMEQGVGVSFTLLEAQKELAAASSRELAAKADLNKSLIDLWLATGTLLERHQIYLDYETKVPASLRPISK